MQAIINNGWRLEQQITVAKKRNKENQIIIASKPGAVSELQEGKSCLATTSKRDVRHQRYTYNWIAHQLEIGTLS